MHYKFLIGILIFVVTFYYIVRDKYPKPLVAMLGGGMMVILRIIDEHEALRAVGENLEILFLLMGLMMIVEIMAESGMFQWMAIKVAQLSRGEPMKILISLSIVTAVGSAFLDNVTTILLIVPVAILLARQLELDPFPFIMMQIFAANIGGAATLIGDPPNLVVGAASKLGFNDFIVNLAPLAILNMLVLIGTAYWYYRKDLQVSNQLRASVMELDASKAIKNPKLLKASAFVFAIVLIGFLTNAITHLGLAIIAITGSAILILVTEQHPEHIFKKIEWETLFFFGGLFVLVDGIEKLGVMEELAKFILRMTSGNKELTSQFILIVSTLLTPILGAVPFALSFVKVIQQLIPNFTGDMTSFWWALSLGACLGGNMTLLGSACNIVGASIAKKSGIDINFNRFLKYGIVVVAQSTILSTLYIYFRY